MICSTTLLVAGCWLLVCLLRHFDGPRALVSVWSDQNLVRRKWPTSFRRSDWLHARDRGPTVTRESLYFGGTPHLFAKFIRRNMEKQLRRKLAAMNVSWNWTCHKKCCGCVFSDRFPWKYPSREITGVVSVIRENRLRPPKNLRMFAGFENESFLFRLKFGPLKLKAEMGWGWIRMGSWGENFRRCFVDWQILGKSWFLWDLHIG